MTRQELKKWREKRGLSQLDLAEHLGVHWKTISSWEQGRQKLSPLLDLALAELDRRLSTGIRKSA